MQDIERILNEAGVKPTAIRIMVMKEIIAIGHTFTLSDNVISVLHTLSSSDKTRIDKVIVPFGSGCEHMLTFAFNEARKEHPLEILGGMDTAMRSCVKSDLLTFSFAAPMFERMVANMDKSFLTTYIWKPLMNR